MRRERGKMKGSVQGKACIWFCPVHFDVVVVGDKDEWNDRLSLAISFQHRWGQLWLGQWYAQPSSWWLLSSADLCKTQLGNELPRGSHLPSGESSAAEQKDTRKRNEAVHLNKEQSRETTAWKFTVNLDQNVNGSNLDFSPPNFYQAEGGKKKPWDVESGDGLVLVFNDEDTSLNLLLILLRMPLDLSLWKCFLNKNRRKSRFCLLTLWSSFAADSVHAQTFIYASISQA